MKNNDPMVWRGVVVMVLTVAVFGWMLGVESTFLLMFLGIFLWIILEVFLGMVKGAKNQKIFRRDGIIVLSETEKEEKRKEAKSCYDYAYSEAKKDARSRYHVDLAGISNFIGMAQGLALNDVQTGREMQHSTGPQTDWAIVGGLTSGLAGGIAGMAAAADTIRQNEEATRRYQEQGRKIEAAGRRSYESLEKSKNDILSSKYDDFLYSVPKSELIDKLTVEVLDTQNYGVGYINATVKILANRDFVFPEGSGKKAVIDGTVRVDLYDKTGKVLMASGYYIPPNRYGNDISKTGFGTESSKSIVLKEELGVSFNEHNGYQVKLSHPNLWLLQL